MDCCICVLNLLDKKKQKEFMTLRDIETKHPAKIGKSNWKTKGWFQFKHTMKSHLFSEEVKAKGKAFNYLCFFFVEKGHRPKGTRTILLYFRTPGQEKEQSAGTSTIYQEDLKVKKKCIKGTRVNCPRKITLKIEVRN